MTSLETWILRYFDAAEAAQALETVCRYGQQSWHQEPERVRRDLIIRSRGSLAALEALLPLANQDYRDILVGEYVDPWIIEQLKQHGP